MDVFLVIDDDLCVDDGYLVRADIKKKFDSEPVYKRKIWKLQLNFAVIKLQIFTIKRCL